MSVSGEKRLRVIQVCNKVQSIPPRPAGENLKLKWCNEVGMTQHVAREGRM